MADGLAIGLVCKGCGQVLGSAMIAPQPTRIEFACVPCLNKATAGNAARTPDDWQAVFQKLGK